MNIEYNDICEGDQQQEQEEGSGGGRGRGRGRGRGNEGSVGIFKTNFYIREWEDCWLIVGANTSRRRRWTNSFDFPQNVGATHMS